MGKQVASLTSGRVTSPGQRGKGRTSLDSARALPFSRMSQGDGTAGAGSGLARAKAVAVGRHSTGTWGVGGAGAETALSEAFHPPPPLGPRKLGVVFNRRVPLCSNAGWQLECNLPFSSPRFLNWTDTC